jgi:uncharacterized protein (TIGR00297 family)
VQGEFSTGSVRVIHSLRTAHAVSGPQILLGAGLAVAVAVLSYRMRALSGSGAIAAAVVGGITFGVGGWPAAVLLLAFFISSSSLSFVGRDAKGSLTEKYSKDSRRDGWQVLANGGLASLLAAGYGLTGAPLWLLGMAGGLAAANADTWGTELGVLAPHRPRRIVGGERVDAGTSGAISSAGLLASLSGAGLIGVLAWLVGGSAWWIMWAAVGGIAGSLFDSLLGATVQAIYWCPNCEKETERHPNHICGTGTLQRRGWHWMDNDVVNALSVSVGAAAAVLIGWAVAW